MRAAISHTITAPATVRDRPGLRFGLIDHALAPDDAIASAVRTATTLTRAAFDSYSERARPSAPRL